MKKEKLILLYVSLAIVFIIAALLYFQPPFFSKWIIDLEKDNYDREVRSYHRPLPEHPSIAIVAIDDASIQAEGRWPWDRSKLAKIADALRKGGAEVIAYDILFPEPERNPIDVIVSSVENPALIQELNALKPRFDSDALFAKALMNPGSVLGFALTSQEKREGELSAPLFTLNFEQVQKSLIPNMRGHIGNIAQFQKSAPNGGFINTMIDADGIIRFSPLLLREGEKVYPALALKAAQAFLSVPFSGVTTTLSQGNLIIQSIELGNLTIPTDPWGRILIPFRGKPYSFPYISATDVLKGKVPREKIEKKLIFIGYHPTASADTFVTAISPVFPGVEIQATIASGIIDRYLPYKPNWGRGSAVAIVLILGVLAAFTFPYIGRIASFLSIIGVILILHGINYWIWTRHQIVLSFFFPTPTLAVIFILDLLSLVIEEHKAKREMQRIFGKSVSDRKLKEIIHKKNELTLIAEKKEITLLVAGIWDFSSLIRPLKPEELRLLLEDYFTNINRAVFERNGVLDPAIGDEIMAFWGAPMEEAKHPVLAVQAALAMCGGSKQKMGIGIHTGMVHVGEVGSKLRKSYTALGDAVDFAIALKNASHSFNAPILISESLWKITQSEIGYKKLGEIEFQGKKEAVYTVSNHF